MFLYLSTFHQGDVLHYGCWRPYYAYLIEAKATIGGVPIFYFEYRQAPRASDSVSRSKTELYHTSMVQRNESKHGGSAHLIAKPKNANT